MPNPNTLPTEYSAQFSHNHPRHAGTQITLANGTIYVIGTNTTTLSPAVWRNTNRGEASGWTRFDGVAVPENTTQSHTIPSDAAMDGDAAPQVSRLTQLVRYNTSSTGIHVYSFNCATETWSTVWTLDSSGQWSHPASWRWDPVNARIVGSTGWTTEKYHGSDYTRVTRTHFVPQTSGSRVDLQLSANVGPTVHTGGYGCTVDPANGDTLIAGALASGTYSVTVWKVTSAGSIGGSPYTTPESTYDVYGQTNRLEFPRFCDASKNVVATYAASSITNSRVQVYSMSGTNPTRTRSDAWPSLPASAMFAGSERWPTPNSSAGGTAYWYVWRVQTTFSPSTLALWKYDPATGVFTARSTAGWAATFTFQNPWLSTWGADTDVYWIGSAISGSTKQWYNFKLQPEGTTFQRSFAGSIGSSGAVTPRQVFNFQRSFAGSIGMAGNVRARIWKRGQRVAPIADRLTTGWTSTGANFYTEIDEDPFSSTDYVTSDSNTVTSPLQLDLPAIVDPGADGTIRIRVWAEKLAGPATSQLVVDWGQISPFQGLSSTQVYRFRQTGVPEYFDFGLDLTNTRRILDQLVAGNAWVQIAATSGSGESVQIRVYSFELLADDATPAGELPGWGDVWAPYEGNFGPVVCNGAYWAIGFTGKRAYLFRATNPTDGNNPGEWVLQRSIGIVGEADGATPYGAELVTQGNVLHWALWYRFANVIPPNFFETDFGAYDTATGDSISGTSLVSLGNLESRPAVTGRSDGDTVAVWGDSGNGARAQVITGASSPTTNFDLSNLSAGTATAGGVKAVDRFHVFITDDANLEDGAIRMRTIRANNTIEAIEAAFSGGPRRTKSGAGASWNNGSQQVAHPMKVTAGGIKVARFVSADDVSNASISEQDATTRQAHHAELADSVFLVVDSNTQRLWSFWIDVADGFNIRAASVNDGETAWTERGEKVAARSGRRILSGGFTKIGSPNVAVFLEADRDGILFYRETSLDLGVTFQQSTAGTIPNAGAVSRSVGSLLEGVLSGAGATLRAVSTAVAGLLSSAGETAKRTASTLAGSITPTGVLSTFKFASRAFAGAIAPVGDLLKRGAATVAGTVHPSGALSRLVATVTAGTLGSAGETLRRAMTTLSGVLAASGVLSTFKFASRAFAGAIAPVGDLLKHAATSAVGVLNSNGDTTKTARSTFAGVLASSGELARQILSTLSGVLAATGELATVYIPGLIQRAFAGTVAAAGELAKRISTAVAGDVTPTGLVTPIQKLAVFVAGTLTTAGELLLRTAARVAGDASPTGTLFKQGAATLEGAIEPSGAVTAIQKLAVFVAGVLASSGELLKRAAAATAGAIGPTGLASKRSTAVFAGAITPTATVVRSARLILSGVLSGVGTVATVYIPGLIQRAFSGVLAASGSLSRVAGRRVAGDAAPAGATVKRTTTTVAGVVNLAGVAVKRFAEVLAGAISSAGALSRSAGRFLSGSLTPTGGYGPTLIRRFVVGALTPTGQTVKRFAVTVAGVLGLLGNVTANKFRTVVGPYGPGRIRQQGRSSSRIQNQGRSSRRI